MQQPNAPAPHLCPTTPAPAQTDRQRWLPTLRGAHPVGLLALLLLALPPRPARAQAPVLTSVAPASGPLDASITITGQNLTGLTSVLVGAVPARFTVSNATTATAFVPRQAVNQRLRISRAGGAAPGSALSAQTFSVTRPTTTGVFPQFPDLTTDGSTLLGVARGAAPTVTDLDGDGLLDLVVGDRGGSVTRFEQTVANGAVFAQVSILAGSPGRLMGDAVPAVTDLDGDGLLDLLVGNTLGRVQRYEQTAVNGGTFAQVGELSANGQTLVVNLNAAPAVTDVDGDGLLDLLVGNGTGTVTRFEQPSVHAGSFDVVGPLTTNGSTTLNVGSYAVPTVTDADADGLLDLFVGSADGNVLYFEQTAASGGVFAPVGLFVTSDGSTGLDVGNYAAPTVTDLDGDGRLDLLVGNSAGNVQRYEQVGQPTITSIAPDTGPLDASVTITGRNLPGLTSVLVGAVPARFTVNSATTATVIVPRQAVNQRLRISRAGGTAPGTDLSAQTFSVTRPGTLGVFPQLPNLTTDGSSALNAGTNAAPTVTDVDSDGMLDLLVGNATGSVTRFEQTAPNGAVFASLGLLTTDGTTALSGGPNSAPAVTDLDGDGLLDLLVGNYIGVVQRFEQTAANGSMFASVGLLTTDGSTNLRVGSFAAPAVTDVDGDGLLDLFVGNSAGTVTRFEQTAVNGDVFALAPLSTDGSSALNTNSLAAPAVTDVDGDGLLDLLVGNSTGTVLRFEQTAPNGAVFAPVGSLTTDGSTALDAGTNAAPAVTDVDGDGLLDLLVGNSTGNVQQYEQTAPPVLTSFAPASGPLDASVTITGLNLRDLTSVLVGAVPARFTVTSAYSATAIVPRQAVNQRLRITRTGGGAPGTALSAQAFAVTRPLAGGAFEPLPDLTTDGTTPVVVNLNAAPAVTDLDGDGLLDLLVGNNAGNVTRFEQTTANGNVFAGVTLLTSNGFSVINMGSKVTPTVTDLDGDGLLDLLVGNSTGSVTRYEQRAANGDVFTPMGSLTTDGSTALNAGPFAAPTVTDVDGDGLLDLLVGNFNGNVLRYEQTAANGDVFAAVASLTTDGSTLLDVGDIATPTVTDVDGDGRLDLLVGNSTGTVLRFEQTAPNGAVFAPVGNLTTDGSTALDAGTNAAPAVTDVDGDGLLDLLVGNGTGNMQRYEQAAPPILTSFTPNNGPLETSVTITGQYLTGLTSVLVGAVPARFTVTSPTTATAIVPRQAVNQRLRISRAGGAAPGTALSAQTFSVDRPSTSGLFLRLPNLTTNGSSLLDVGTKAAPAVTDVDGDGLLDLLVGNSAGTVTRHEQTAANGDVFAAVSLLTTDGSTALNAGSYATPAVTDVDGDGRLDLLVGNNAGNVRRYEQTAANGDVFAAVGLLTTDGSTLLDVGDSATPIVTDVDGDGLLDLLVGNLDGNVTRYEQTAANGAVFAPVGTLTTNGSTALDAGDSAAPTVTDVDGNGRLDLLVGNDAGLVARYEQTVANGGVFALVGSLTTDGTTVLNVGNYAAPVVTDVDGDGRLDLLVGNFNGNVQRYQQPEAPTISGCTPASGPLETSVTVTGQNLTGLTSVLVGAVPARFTVSAPTTATVIVPRQAVNQRLRISRAGGTALSTQAFAVTRPHTTGGLLRLPNLTTDGTASLDVGDSATPTVTDVDGDGLLDLLVGNYDGNVRRYEQTAANGSTFAPAPLTTDGTSPLTTISKAVMTVTDVDGDGLLDLLVGNLDGNVTRYEQTAANGTVFAPVGPLTTNGTTALDVRSASAPTVTDVDGDGLLDLLVGNTEGNVLRYEQTTANGDVFAPSPLTTDGTNAPDADNYSIPTVTDVDGDGLLDLLVGSFDGNVTRFEQTTANGSVFALVGSLTTDGPSALNVHYDAAPAVTDVDGDGLLDLLVGDIDGNVRRFEQVAAAPLPVELTAFTATPTGPVAVRLAWTTASEKNSASFDVERSLDGRTFARIGTVAAAGTSSSVRRYELLDADPSIHQSTIYYRLRQVDADGTASYSPVRTVARTGAAAGLALYPNPAHGGAATLAGALPGASVTVYDALGRPVTSATADASGTAALALPAGLPAGVYVVRAGTKAVRLTVE
jgi:uncharacterized protein (DUF2141 family)